MKKIFNGKEVNIAPFSYLSGADLRYADLRYENLSGSVLSGADLREADLRDADLRYAVLRDADLRGAKIDNCVGNGKEIISAQLNEYNVVIYDDLICIGCESHRAHEWEEFDDKRIIKMDGEDFLKWWRKNKSTVFCIYNSIDIK